VPYQLKITLQGIDPPVWRRVVVPSEFSLFDLHCVIQLAMGWENCHLHDFTIKRQRYALPDPEGFDDLPDESETLLRDIVRPRNKFVYQYDFGDCWNHVILVEKALDDAAIPGPICVDGARACPPEDSGGPWGYADKLEALSDPDDEESEDLREWMGADFDPELFDANAVTKELQKPFDRHRARRRRPRGGDSAARARRRMRRSPLTSGWLVECPQTASSQGSWSRPPTPARRDQAPLSDSRATTNRSPESAPLPRARRSPRLSSPPKIFQNFTHQTAATCFDRSASASDRFVQRRALGLV
jgi:hypothetical protein